jgi:hypothetical protein
LVSILTITVDSMRRYTQVHDGQQRLVTISLLLAAFRDFFAQDRFVQHPVYKDNASQAAANICPDKTRLERITRITLREKEGELLKSILVNRLDMNEDEQLKLPSKNQRRTLPPRDQRMLEVFDYFQERIVEMDDDSADNLFRKLLEDVFLVVTIPTDTRTARNLVMGQSKGKDVEPVDYFKGMVCFNFIEDEATQDATLESWNELCDEVGRETLEAACLLLAQAHTCKPLRKSGEIDLMEDFLKRYVSEHGDGRTFYDKLVVPYAKKLYYFRDSQNHLKSAEQGRNTPSLSFLRAASQITTSKEIELVVLHFLVNLKVGTDSDEARSHILMLERIALWMLLTKPKAPARRTRCFDIVRSAGNAAALETALKLSHEEKQEINIALRTTEFRGAAALKTAKAVLERMNECTLLNAHQSRVTAVPGTLQIEHVLPQKFENVASWKEHWDSAKATALSSRLGNLALLNQKTNVQLSNGPFENKKKEFENSPYPLTKRISQAPIWDPATVEEQHEELHRLAVEVWQL